jgi:anti-sigma factor RsiW
MNALSPAARSELLAGYVLGDLSPAEQAMVEEYLANHPEAQAELLELQNTWMLLPLALPEVQPGKLLRDRILQEAMVMEPQAVLVEKRQLRQQRRGLWATVGLAVLGAIGCGGLCWQNYRLQSQVAMIQDQQQLLAQELQRSRQQTELALQQSREQQTILSRPDTRLLPVKAMGKTAGSGSLVLAPVKTKALLTLQKVPALPEGQVYRIWALKEDGERACGHFRPDAKGLVTMELPLSDWDGAKGISITIEKLQATEAEGPEVMGGEIKI